MIVTRPYPRNVAPEDLIVAHFKLRPIPAKFTIPKKLVTSCAVPVSTCGKLTNELITTRTINVKTNQGTLTFEVGATPSTGVAFVA